MAQRITHQAPAHPGETLVKEYLNPMGISQRELADGIQVPYQRVNELINQKRGVTPATALRLARFLDMSPEFWLNLQSQWDLYRAHKCEQVVLDAIKPWNSEQRRT